MTALTPFCRHPAPLQTELLVSMLLRSVLTLTRGEHALPQSRVETRHDGRACQSVAHVTRVVTRVAVSDTLTRLARVPHLVPPRPPHVEQTRMADGRQLPTHHVT